MVISPWNMGVYYHCGYQLDIACFYMGFHGYYHWYGISIWDINMGLGIQWGFNKQDIPRKNRFLGIKHGWLESPPGRKIEVFILMEKSTTINYCSPLKQKHLIAGWLLFLFHVFAYVFGWFCNSSQPIEQILTTMLWLPWLEQWVLILLSQPSRGCWRTPNSRHFADFSQWNRQRLP